MNTRRKITKETIDKKKRSSGGRMLEKYLDGGNKKNGEYKWKEKIYKKIKKSGKKISS